MMDDGRLYKMTDDPNTEFKKRCYDDEGNNICKALERKAGMAIIFDDCLSVEVEGVIKCLTDAGYKLEMRAKIHHGEVAVFDL
jgi:hypothetical protein